MQNQLKAQPTKVDNSTQLEEELKEVNVKMEKLEKQKNDFKQKYLNAFAEAKELKDKLQQAQDQALKMGDEIKDYKTDNENCLTKIKRLNEGRL